MTSCRAASTERRMPTAPCVLPIVPAGWVAEAMASGTPMAVRRRPASCRVRCTANQLAGSAARQQRGTSAPAGSRRAHAMVMRMACVRCAVLVGGAYRKGTLGGCGGGDGDGGLLGGVGGGAAGGGAAGGGGGGAARAIVTILGAVTASMDAPSDAERLSVVDP